MLKPFRQTVWLWLLVIPGITSSIAQPIMFAQTADELAPCVVYLQIPRVKTTYLDTVLYQLYIRKPTEPSPRPYADTVRGTGFFVANLNSLYLVTASQLAQLMDTSAILTVKTGGDRPLRLSLSQFLGGGVTPNWMFSQEADVAVLRLFPSPETFEILQHHCLPFEILDPNEKVPSREKTLTVLGFPLKLGVTGHFSPISLDSRVSSGLADLARDDSEEISTFFLIDKPLARGFKGAPVFELVASYSPSPAVPIGGDRFICVGLVHGTTTDDAGGELAAVVPSAFIVEAILWAQR